MYDSEKNMCIYVCVCEREGKTMNNKANEKNVSNR